MNTLLLIYLITYPICAVVCAGLVYGTLQAIWEGEPTEQAARRHSHGRTAVIMGAACGLFSFVGILIPTATAGYVHFKLPFTR